MYCRNCGAENTEGAKFCKKCGAPLGQKADGKNNTDRGKQKKRRGLFLIMGFLILLVGVICVLIFGVRGRSFKFSENDNNTHSADSNPAEGYLAAVRDSEGKWGYINEKGEEVISCQYDSVINFSSKGVAAVGVKSGIDLDGLDTYDRKLINARMVNLMRLVRGLLIQL